MKGYAAIVTRFEDLTKEVYIRFNKEEFDNFLKELYQTDYDKLETFEDVTINVVI